MSQVRDRQHLLRIDAAAVADARDSHVPGTILLETAAPLVTLPNGSLHAPWNVLAVGSPAQVDTHPAGRLATPLRFPDHVLLPGLVNAHTHLDLTRIGPRPFDPALGFLGFVETVRRERPADPQSIADAVRAGAALSLDSGVVAVGDIGGAPAGRPSAAAYETLRTTPLHGVGFIEFFAIGLSEAASLERMESLLRDLPPPTPAVRPGLQPHASNTISPRAYRWAISAARARGLPLATHLAESPEEHEFITQATGPQRALLERVGAWCPAILDDFGKGRSPVAHFADAVGHAPPPFILAHVNDLGPDLARLRALGASVAYCPRASAYFGAEHHFGPHQYTRLLEAGVNVALGTDSIINLPPGRSALSILDEMRFLRARDGTSASTLLQMATVNGARALGLPESGFLFREGHQLAGAIAIPCEPGTDPLAAAIDSPADPRPILLGRPA